MLKGGRETKPDDGTRNVKFAGFAKKNAGKTAVFFEGEDEWGKV